MSGVSAAGLHWGAKGTYMEFTDPRNGIYFKMRGLGGFPSDLPFIVAIDERHFGDEVGELPKSPEPRSFQTATHRSCADSFNSARTPFLA